MKEEMTNIQFIDTAGQITAVVIDEVKRAEQPKFASEILKAEICEQVAFIESGVIPRLQMMGNELNINGTLAGAFVLSQLSEKIVISLVPSGLESPVVATYKKGKILVELPRSIIVLIQDNRVVFKGIMYTLERGIPKQKVLNQSQLLKLKSTSKMISAAGFIFYEADEICPVVYVQETNSVVWESACGSGSLAFSLLKNVQKVKQPSEKVIQIQTTGDTLTITTSVEKR